MEEEEEEEEEVVVFSKANCGLCNFETNSKQAFHPQLSDKNHKTMPPCIHIDPVGLHCKDNLPSHLKEKE
jgi:hypothetical protein